MSCVLAKSSDADIEQQPPQDQGRRAKRNKKRACDVTRRPRRGARTQASPPPRRHVPPRGHSTPGPTAPGNFYWVLLVLPRVSRLRAAGHLFILSFPTRPVVARPRLPLSVFRRNGTGAPRDSLLVGGSFPPPPRRRAARFDRLLATVLSGQHYQRIWSSSSKRAANMATYTIDDALSAMGFGKFQALVLAYAGMGWVAEAMELMLLSFLGPQIREEWNVSPENESLLSSVVFAGMLIGACTWGFVSDNYGRRTGLLFSTLFTTVVGCLSALSPNYFCLVALRFLVGVGVGGSHVFISWFLEFVPAQNRGTWMVIFSGFWTLGTVLEASLAWVVLSALNWRWLLAFTALPCFLLLPFFGSTSESPRYLCVQNRMSDATAVMEKIAIANQSALPPGVLVYHGDSKDDHNSLASENEYLLDITEKEYAVDDAMSSESGSIAALRKLLSRKLLKSTLLIWFAFFANSFAYYGLVLLTSELSDANQSCSSGVIKVHQKETNLYKDTFITSLAEIPGLILSAVLVDWFGRKASMWSMIFACCAFLGPLMLPQHELLTTILLFGARSCAMGSFTILCLYAPEVYPTSVRSTGVGIATAIGRIGGVVCPIIAVAMLRGCHQMGAIMVFELVLFLAGITCIFFPVETKGREMD